MKRYDPFFEFFGFAPERDAAHEAHSSVTETKEAWHVEVDMPGVPKEKMEVSVVGNELLLGGERKRGDETLKYKKVFRLPNSVKGDGIEAVSDLGVLRVKIPKGGSGLLQIPVA